MASQQFAPGPDVNGAPKLMAITGALYVVIIILYGARLYTRLRPVPRLGWDDYMITMAIILAFLEWGLLIGSVAHGMGRHNFYIPPSEQIKAGHLLFAAEVPWSLTLMFIKISIACMLLRIKQSRGWLRFLYLMIVVQVLSCAAAVIFQLLECRPIRAIWDPTTPGAKCVMPAAAHIQFYITSSIVIVTDVIFSLLPLTFIRKMQISLREKIVLTALMGLGVFAACASIVRTTLVKRYGQTGDTLWDSVDLCIWTSIEEQVGIIAACIPCLKSPFERLLDRLGLLSSRGGGSDGYIAYDNSNTHALSSFPQRRSMGAHKGADAQSEESILPPVSPSYHPDNKAGNILKTTELHFSTEDIPPTDRVLDGDEEAWKVQGERGHGRPWGGA